MLAVPSVDEHKLNEQGHSPTHAQPRVEFLQMQPDTVNRDTKPPGDLLISATSANETGDLRLTGRQPEANDHVAPARHPEQVGKQFAVTRLTCWRHTGFARVLRWRRYIGVAPSGPIERAFGCVFAIFDNASDGHGLRLHALSISPSPSTPATSSNALNSPGVASVDSGLLTF